MHRTAFLLFTIILCIQASAISLHEKKSYPAKILTITVTESGKIVMGRDTLITSELAKEIKTRFWKSFLGTDRMHDAIKLEYSGEVSPAVRTAVIDAIHEGQKMALKEVCLEKYKKFYEDMSSSHQEKIKKQFPVLFQTDYS
jgi:hypothetical protein